MLDGVDAGDHGAPHAFRTVGVGGHAITVIPGRRDDGGNFRLRELRVLAACGLAEHAAGGGDLDQVRTFLVAGAHRLVGVVHTVDDALGRTRIAAQRPVDAVGGIGVSAGGGETLSGGENARPDDMAFGHGAADGLGHEVVGAQIPYGGESRQQGSFRIRYRPQRQVRGLQREFLDETVGAQLATDMHVHVDPAGHDEGAGQVDVRLAHIAHLHVPDAIALHHDGCRVDHFTCGRVEQLARVDNRLSTGSTGQEQRQYRDRDPHDISGYLWDRTE